MNSHTWRRAACSLVTAAMLCGTSAQLRAATAGARAKGLRGVVHAHKARALGKQAKQRLAQDSAVVVSGSEPHFFALYDRNAYAGVPSFVTVDAVLHVFHLRLDALIEQSERASALPALRAFASAQAERALALLRAHPDASTQLRPLAAYHLVARALVEPGALAQPGAGGADPATRQLVEQEVARIRSASGRGDGALCPRGLDYTLFKPRGHYQRYQLDDYFRAVTFYAQCGFALSSDAELARALDVLRLLDAPSRAQLETLLGFIRLMVGPADDPGVAELERIAGAALPSLPAAVDRQRLARVRAQLAKLPAASVSAQAAPGELPAPVFRLLGGAGTFDSALFSRTADWRAGRPFPSALDLLGALGSADARELLRDQRAAVPALDRALASEAAFELESIYGRWLDVLREVVKAPDEAQPAFSRSAAWQRHLTVAAAGSWAELRHDTLLYVKQPMVWAQGGHGDELPAIKAGGYVEPRPEVYRKLRALLDQVTLALTPAGARDTPDQVARLRELLDFLIEVSELELTGAPVPRAVDRRLRQIGVELERLTLGHGDELPPQALIADVFSHAEPSGATRTLHVAIGDVDELWVIVPRAGRRVLMRGGVFSYYELVGAPGERLDDPEWMSRLRAKSPPPRPTWATPLRGPRPARRHGRGS
jgi:hypothetical protein